MKGDRYKRSTTESHVAFDRYLVPSPCSKCDLFKSESFRRDLVWYLWEPINVWIPIIYPSGHKNRLQRYSSPKGQERMWILLATQPNPNWGYWLWGRILSWVSETVQNFKSFLKTINITFLECAFMLCKIYSYGSNTKIRLLLDLCNTRCSNKRVQFSNKPLYSCHWQITNRISFQFQFLIGFWLITQYLCKVEFERKSALDRPH